MLRKLFLKLGFFEIICAWDQARLLSVESRIEALELVIPWFRAGTETKKKLVLEFISHCRIRRKIELRLERRNSYRQQVAA
jgi:hypothetical protein